MCGGRHQSAGQRRSTGGGRTVQVRGYMRANGTYVAGYTRSAPGSAKSSSAVPPSRSRTSGYSGSTASGKRTPNTSAAIKVIPPAIPPAPSPSGSATSSRKIVHVRGYTKSNGKYVAGYTRSSPGSRTLSSCSGSTASTHENRSFNQGPVRVFIPPAASPSGLSSSRKTVHVKGYTRSNGTHVDGYTRSPPLPKGNGSQSSSTANHNGKGSFSSITVASGYSLLTKSPSPGSSRSPTCVASSLPTTSTKKPVLRAIPVSSVPITTTGDGTQLQGARHTAVAKSAMKIDKLYPPTRLPADSVKAQAKDTYRWRHSPPLDVRAKRDPTERVAQGSICLLAHDSDEFSRVTEKFTKAWCRQKGRCPAVNFVFKVTNDTLEQKWITYKSTVREKDIKELYHGTKLACKITTSWKPCNIVNCGICGISCSGLDPQCINRDRFQRFGPGFYLAPDSSKCHDYTQGYNGFRAMLLCDVLPGRRFVVETNRQHLQGPPTGYDSVYGNVGEDLNYPELVVYKPEAVLPRYIIIYRWRHSPPLDVRAKRDPTERVAQGSICLLAHDSDKFSRVTEKFTKAWCRQKGRCPAVSFVFKVTNDTLEQKWITYKSTVREKDIKELYHGTKLACKITTSWKPCNIVNCGICGISCSGLDPQCISRDSFQRFGPGFYLAPDSSKCHDYTQGYNGFRAMLLCDVLPGRRFVVETNRQHLQGPPTGYDSVYGNVGEDLNYPELVVYKPEAVLPRYIIIYRSRD